MATAYVAVDGHRSDDLKPYIFVTHDYGKTFQNIAGTLPQYGNVQVVKEDPKNRNLLYAGTEFGMFVSLDAGAHWEKFMTNYPTVRTDDIPDSSARRGRDRRDARRSLWIADDVTPLQQFTPAVASEDVHLFDVRSAIAYLFDYRTDADVGGDHRFEGENAPRGTAISYYLKSAPTGPVTVSIVNALGQVVCTSTGPSAAGFIVCCGEWTLVAPGTDAWRAPSEGGRRAGGVVARAARPDRRAPGGGGGGARVERSVGSARRRRGCAWRIELTACERA
jgi:hypothetical protein